MLQVNQVEFQLTFLWSRLVVLVTEQSRHYVYAFQMEAPTDEIYETSLNSYLLLEEEIQDCLLKLYQIKGSLK